MDFLDDKLEELQELEGVSDLFTADDTQEPETYYVHNRSASDLEWRVAQALDKMKIFYIFQFPINGGTTRRGGYVLDFYVQSAPKWRIIEVQGERWHTGKFGSDERLREAMITQIMGIAPDYLWENELETVADAIQAVRRLKL